MPARILNWDVALHDWARSVVGHPFAWGETDCATLVRRALAVMYGEDLFPDLPSYDSQTAALRVQAARGDVAAHLLGLGAELVPLAFLQQGDVVIGPGEAGEEARSVAVVLGSLALSVTTATGVGVVPVSLLVAPMPPDAVQAYRVPFTVPGEER